MAENTFRAAQVPGGQIRPSAFPLILMLDVLGTVRCRRQGRVPTTTGLNAGLRVRTKDAVGRSQRLAFPNAFVEIEDASGLFGKGGITGKNPASETPGTERVAAQPTPQRGATDFRHEAFGQHFAVNLGQREARQRETSARGKLAGQGFNLDDHAGGKSGRAARPEVPPQGPSSAPSRSACATY